MDEKNLENEIDLVEIICRQTALTYTEAKQKLINTNYDHILVIQEYLSSSKKSNQEILKNEDSNGKNLNINQETYKEIRKLMNSASKNYREKVNKNTI